MQRTKFIVILGHFFLPFDPPNNPKSEKFEKIKKMAEDIIILHLCTTKDNHNVWFLIYQAWQTEFFVILGYFQKIQILKKWKKLLEMFSFTQVYHKWQSYDIWFLRYQLQQTDIFGHFWPFFALLPPKNENITKLKKKKHLEISSFYTSVPKIMITGYTVPETWFVPDVIVSFHFELFFTLSPH